MAIFECNDALVKYLKDLGFNLVQFPRPNIAPLQILYKVKKGEVGLADSNLDQLVASELSLPEIKANIQVPQIENGTSDAFNLKAGFSLFKNFVSALNKFAGGNASAKPAPLLDNIYKDSDQAKFAYNNCLVDQISLVDLDNYLLKSKLKNKKGFFADKAKSGEIYIITSVLKSNNFIVEMQEQSEGRLNSSLEQLKTQVEADLDVQMVSGEKESMSFSGPAHLIFGFKAVKLMGFEEEDHLTFSLAGDLIARRGEEEAPQEEDIEKLSEALVEDQNFLNLHMGDPA
ncbi:MAG: hypothetical protein AAFU64_08085 [Bacteroidota bacterium]